MCECEQLKKTVAKKDQHIRAMDIERDELQNELDQETERRKQFQDELAVLKCQTDQFGTEIDKK